MPAGPVTFSLPSPACPSAGVSPTVRAVNAPAAALRLASPVCFSAVAAVGLCLFAAAAAPGTTAPAAAPVTTVPAVPPPAPGPAVVAPAAAAPEDLRFDEFFQRPIGPRGLEFSARLRELHGKRVRLVGHMVNHVHANPRVVILAPLPLKFHQCEYGLCDDLPAASVHVHVPGDPRHRIAFAPGEIALTGRLAVGNVEELDGRISAVRLFVDAEQAAALRTVPK